MYVLSPLEEWWVLPVKWRVVTQAEPELQGEHTAIALEKFPVTPPTAQRHQELPLAAAQRELWGWGL